jgi:hypothetical protein
MDAKGIARALRTQLKTLGFELSHSQTLELLANTAGDKDWNVFVAKAAMPVAETQKPTEGFFCPKCGKHGKVTQVASAFVQQGPSNEDGSMFEGDADHLECASCGHQFLNWRSTWPAYLRNTGYVVLLDKSGMPGVAKLYELGVVCAVLGVHGSGVSGGRPYDDDSLDGSAMAALFNLEVCEHGDNHELIAQLLGYGVEPIFTAQGATPHVAVTKLLSELPSEMSSQVVLNSDIEINY